MFTDVAGGGKCEACGGPQVWTMYLGERFVACARDCSPLLGEVFESPVSSVKRGEELSEAHWEPLGETGVDTPEGGDADEVSGDVLIHIGVPLEAVLLSLWEGGPLPGGDDGETS